MRKTRKAAVVAVLLGTVGFLGAGTAYAHGDGHGDGKGHGHGKGHGKGHGHGHGHGQKPRDAESKTVVITQSTSCSATDENTDVQGESASGNWTNGEVSPGPQTTNIGSRLGCDNTLVLGK
ncbi:hypothetical protein [Streptomyces sp. NBC_00847]|uniref:hypothetical protein n=1 Tax=unclassified Streptomyces TaxID=2593676 RepID=UPI00225199B6|nr:hypothetical protein [Streptomyces sp. NBC_00847]MCX4881472.1 hypothetical protein [Streptomyces sp. NBC_00847]